MYRRNFKCEDETCAGKIDLKYKWDDDLVPEKCPLCKKDCFEIFPEEVNAPAIGKFTNASPAERHAILKKRSSEHFNKEIKERKHQMHVDMYRNMNRH